MFFKVKLQAFSKEIPPVSKGLLKISAKLRKNTKIHRVRTYFLEKLKHTAYICAKYIQYWGQYGQFFCIMNILLTNDDGYKAKGIGILADILKDFGEVTVIAPKRHQSGMSMAVSMGGQAIAYKELGDRNGARWAYLDATPASCVKFALNGIVPIPRPDIVVSGINHGSNAASAVCYSGTLGAAAEAALDGIPGIGVSLDTSDADADFGTVRKYLPDILDRLLASLPTTYGVYYNINFPDENIPVLGTRTASQGMGRWIKEYLPWDKETFRKLGLPENYGGSVAAGDGERLFIMSGEFLDDERNPRDADHRYNKAGYISIVPHNIDCTDRTELMRLRKLGFDINY